MRRNIFKVFRCRAIETKGAKNERTTNENLYSFVSHDLFLRAILLIAFLASRAHERTSTDATAHFIVVCIAFCIRFTNKLVSRTTNTKAWPPVDWDILHYVQRSYLHIYYLCVGAQCRAPSEWPHSKRQAYLMFETFNLTQSSVECVKSSFDPIDFIMLLIFSPSYWHVARLKGNSDSLFCFTHFDMGHDFWRVFSFLSLPFVSGRTKFARN